MHPMSSCKKSGKSSRKKWWSELPFFVPTDVRGKEVCPECFSSPSVSAAPPKGRKQKNVVVVQQGRSRKYEEKGLLFCAFFVSCFEEEGLSRRKSKQEGETRSKERKPDPLCPQRPFLQHFFLQSKVRFFGGKTCFPACVIAVIFFFWALYYSAWFINGW